MSSVTKLTQTSQSIAMDEHHPPPPPPPTDPASQIFIISYYTFGTIGLPLFILLASLYCWARKRLWDCCCYYDVESALESQSPSPNFPCLARAPPQPPRWGLEIPPPDRIQEISAACSDCAICTGSLEGDADRCSILPLCGHRFHKVCVYIWLNKKATCPVCRRFYPFPVRSKLILLLKQEKNRLFRCL